MTPRQIYVPEAIMTKNRSERYVLLPASTTAIRVTVENTGRRTMVLPARIEVSPAVR